MLLGQLAHPQPPVGLAQAPTGPGDVGRGRAGASEAVDEELVEDGEAPLPIAKALHVAISGSKLVVLPDAGHVCNVEAPDEFNAAVRNFLHDSRS